MPMHHIMGMYGIVKGKAHVICNLSTGWRQAQPHTQVTLPWQNEPPVLLHKRPIRTHGNVQLIKGKKQFLHMYFDTCIIH